MLYTDFKARDLENYEYIIFCFAKISKFGNFKMAFMNFAKSIIADIFTIFKNFAKQTIYPDYPDHVLRNDVQHV